MAVRLQTTIKRFDGRSKDRKPVPYALGGNMAEGESLPIGSVFYETDTNRELRWEGGRWVYQPDLAGIMEATRAINAEILVKLGEIEDLLRKRAAG